MTGITPIETKRRLILALGGTGVIGRSLAATAEKNGLYYCSLSLSVDSADAGSCNKEADLSSASAEHISRILDSPEFAAPIIGIVDVLGTKGPAAQAIAEFAARRNIPLAVVSSCLLYDHDGYLSVDETSASFTGVSAPHPYHLNKLRVEAFWKSQPLDWLILRTHHVLGRGSLLGCVPGHNRDPLLLQRLRAGETLALASCGEVMLSYVHPDDLARITVDLLLSRTASNEIINVVHPMPTKARDYYALIADALGVDFSEPSDFPLEPQNFWAATAKDNIYRSSHSFMESRNFQHDITACIQDALLSGENVYPTLGQFLRRRISG